MPSIEQRVERLSKRQKASCKPQWDAKKLAFESDLLAVAKTLEHPTSDWRGDWRVRLLGSRYRSWKASGRELPPLPPEDIAMFGPTMEALNGLFSEWWAYETALTARQTDDED